jgi:hypothetical protein
MSTSPRECCPVAREPDGPARSTPTLGPTAKSRTRRLHGWRPGWCGAAREVSPRRAAAGEPGRPRAAGTRRAPRRDVTAHRCAVGARLTQQRWRLAPASCGRDPPSAPTDPQHDSVAVHRHPEVLTLALPGWSLSRERFRTLWLPAHHRAHVAAIRTRAGPSNRRAGDVRTPAARTARSYQDRRPAPAPSADRRGLLR